SGTSAAAHLWSDHGRNHNSTHGWDARHVSVWLCSCRLGAACARSSPLGAPPAAVCAGRSRDRPASVPPSTGRTASDSKTVDIAPTGHEYEQLTRALHPCLAAGVWYYGAGTTRDTHAAH